MAEEEPPECYVCAGTSPPLRSELCLCADRHIHLSCQRQLLTTVSRDGKCTVCRFEYRNLRRPPPRLVVPRAALVCAYLGSLALSLLLMRALTEAFHQYALCTGPAANATSHSSASLCEGHRAIERGVVVAGLALGIALLVAWWASRCRRPPPRSLEVV